MGSLTEKHHSWLEEAISNESTRSFHEKGLQK